VRVCVLCVHVCVHLSVCPSVCLSVRGRRDGSLPHRNLLPSSNASSGISLPSRTLLRSLFRLWRYYKCYFLSALASCLLSLPLASCRPDRPPTLPCSATLHTCVTSLALSTGPVRLRQGSEWARIPFPGCATGGNPPGTYVRAL
jgi:hypothetical protein